MPEQSSTQLSHVGLFVTDLDKMVHFYTHSIGFVVTDRGAKGDPTFMSRSSKDHHQLILRPGRPEGVKEMVQQLSFKLGSLAEVQKVYARIRDSEATGLEPVTHGIAWSIYFRDPENNRVEMFADTEWYITQPFRSLIDLEKPTQDLYREVEALCMARPDFKPMTQWRAEFEQKWAAAQ
jgi:catechol-2,3-dioxygenase